jgi:hypothetical protein
MDEEQNEEEGVYLIITLDSETEEVVSVEEFP